MSEQNSAAVPGEPTTFWLVGVRLDPNFSHPDFYTMVTDNPAYWPITYKNQIILFQALSARQAALDFYLGQLGLPPKSAPEEPTLILDFAQAFYLLSQESSDEESCLLNIINTVLDMLKATSVAVPAMYRADLHQLADHLTFNREFASFLKDQQLDRTEIIEALQWSLGAVLSRSMFFPKPGVMEEIGKAASH